MAVYGTLVLLVYSYSGSAVSLGSLHAYSKDFACFSFSSGWLFLCWVLKKNLEYFKALYRYNQYIKLKRNLEPYRFIYDILPISDKTFTQVFIDSDSAKRPLQKLKFIYQFR